MNRYEIRNQDDEGLVGIVSTHGAKAVLDRDAAEARVYEVDSIGRRRAKGLSAAVGYDPLGEPNLVLVVLDLAGGEVSREAIVEVGEAEPSTVLMPEDEPVQGND